MKNSLGAYTTELSKAKAFSGLSSPPFILNNLTQNKILNYFQNTWSLTELLFSSLKGKRAFYQPPYHNLRHPLIFYYGHTAACYVNKLILGGILAKPINPYFEKIFEVGVDEMSWDDMSKNTMIWPTIPEVKAYRETVYQTVCELIQTHPAFGIDKIRWDDAAWSLMLSLEHERIHLETSSVLIRELPIELVEKPKDWPTSIFNSDSPESEMMFLPEQNIVLGKDRETPYYGWDNEYGQRKVSIKSLKAGKYLVTNGEFQQFVKAKGYHDSQFWTEKGWKWRCFRNIQHPTFWIPNESEDYKLRTCFEIFPMQKSWPAVVNYYEAKAYCKWLSQQDNKTYRLLTEVEHHALREDALISKIHGAANINLQYGSESPVNGFPQNNKGFFDTFGNVWQWCEDYFNPLPGFKTHAYYDDFSTPCFDGKHQMIMGGSFMSTGDESTPWARFHFRPHFFQHAGFRVVEAS
jgi:5-histidylcysteine sulfoxide synthase